MTISQMRRIVISIRSTQGPLCAASGRLIADLCAPGLPGSVYLFGVAGIVARPSV